MGFFHQYKDGVDWVFVDHLSYQRLGNPYGDHNGAFGDNLYRYTLLNHAACEAPLVLGLGGFPYGQNVTFIANDWHAGLVPPLIASKYRVHGVYKDARVIFAVHNLLHQARHLAAGIVVSFLALRSVPSLFAHLPVCVLRSHHLLLSSTVPPQGVEPIHNYQYLGLPPDWCGVETPERDSAPLGAAQGQPPRCLPQRQHAAAQLAAHAWFVPSHHPAPFPPPTPPRRVGALMWVYPEHMRAHALDKGETVNFLKGAIVTCDRVVTVSSVRTRSPLRHSSSLPSLGWRFLLAERITHLCGGAALALNLSWRQSIYR